MKKGVRELLRVTAVLALLAAVMLGAPARADAAEGISGTLTEAVCDSIVQSFGYDNNFVFKASDTGELLQGYCMEAAKHSVIQPGWKASAEEVGGSLRVLMYLAWQNGWSASDFPWNYIVARTADCLRRGVTVYDAAATSTRENGQALLDQVLAYSGSVPISFRAYRLSYNANRQDVLTYRIEPVPGQVRVVKTSSDTSVTAGSPFYGLEGAVFGAYASQEEAMAASYGNAGASLAMLTTGADGSTPVSGDLDAGTYYVKELKAPKGYALNASVSAVTVEEGEVSTVSVSDAPLLAQTGTMLQKRDSRTGLSEPQGAASLKGAEYTVSFYAAADTSGSPARTWVFVTDESGKICYSDTYKVSGPALFRDSSGAFALPAGTLTIKETKPPEGYMTDETVHTVRFALTEDGTVRPDRAAAVRSGAWDLDPVSDEKIVSAGYLEIKKTDAETGETPQGGTSFEGIEFTVKLADHPDNAPYVTVDGTEYRQGQTILTITTDADGIARTPEGLLPYAYYTVDESFVPESCGMIRGDWSATVFLSGGVVQESAVNRTARGGVSFVKKDASTGLAEPWEGGSLEGAEISIFSDCDGPVIVGGTEYGKGDMVMTLTTDAEGRCSTEADALPYGRYYAVETKASSGYFLNEEWRAEFSIEKDGVIVETEALQETPDIPEPEPEPEPIPEPEPEPIPEPEPEPEPEPIPEPEPEPEPEPIPEPEPEPEPEPIPEPDADIPDTGDRAEILMYIAGTSVPIVLLAGLAIGKKKK